MVRTLTRRYSTHNSGSFRIMRMIESPGRHQQQQQNPIPSGNDHADDVDSNLQEKSIGHQQIGDSLPGNPPERPPSDMDLMKEKFAKLLLGEDMSGGGKGVSSALALSNAVTNLAASVFGEQVKLGPMAPETKARWRREMDWFLSVTDHIVEFVPSQQKTKDGTSMEIMVTRQRNDLLVNIPGLRKLDTMLIETLDSFGQEQEFWYVSKNDDQDNENCHRDEKWWHPTVKVPANGLSETSRKSLQCQKESVNQVLKAAMAINAEVLSEMEVPESYIESLPKNGRSSLGDSIYKGITVEYFDPSQFLATMDLSTEHKVLDLKNRIEASIIIWKRKLHHKDGRSSWGSSVSLEKREIFEERAETILILLKQRFPGIPQSTLDISKIQYNRDVGHAILESYSRTLESLAFNVMSRIEDVLHADCLAQISSPARSEGSSGSSDEDAVATSATDTPTLSDFMGWGIASRRRNSTDLEIYFKGDIDNDKKPSKPGSKKSEYLEKLESCGIRSPNARD
ncbi:ROP (rho of plants) guanine nucleotide exchange factor 9 [Hibiscus trionum]|uniref:ROP (Rho of plants) guanine nucleotide exchange factor 9 n=1 Tax=Hibiscus trionum TaxID=183268 RepID=A0A9W7MB04_HIBTR|nr:ROP (rho of plants) guanine nucleotide exchange factor 9 [Hibiscus trionum]